MSFEGPSLDLNKYKTVVLIIVRPNTASQHLKRDLLEHFTGLLLFAYAMIYFGIHTDFRFALKRTYHKMVHTFNKWKKATLFDTVLKERK